MNRQRDDRNQRIADYLRRRGATRLPATFTDDVVRAAAATPQDRGTTTWFRTPLLAAATVVLAIAMTLGGLSLIDPPVGDDPTPVPSVPAASDTPTPGPSASATVEPEPTEEPSPTTEPSPTPAAVQPGDVLVAVTDNLVVRAEPGLESEIYEVQLQPGDLLLVTEGAASADGFDWYQGRVLDSSAPDGTRTGWVAAADTDATPWLASPQAEGDGWRLLGQAAAGEPYTVGVATSADELPALWTGAGIDDPVPSIDFAREVVVRYTHAVSGTCPEIELEGIGVDDDARIVYSVVTLPSSPLFEGRACTSDAQPHSFVVAVERERLPSGDVNFRLQRGFIACPDCGRESEQTTVILP
ncbi:MAG: hypothetical protein ABR593_09050 [Candidatus Limnocylindria bacterium]